MLELLAQVDPLAALLGGLWLFAAGLFPVGFMLGSSCSACCEPCSACTQGSLPDTITATLEGFTDYSKKQLCTLSFSACYGSGGSGTLDAPGHSSPESDPVDDRGPITAVSLTDGGSGYAKLGRVAPALTISGGSGTGATFTPTLSSSQDACKLDVWSLTSVAASGGTGYVSGEALTITASDGDTQVQAASAKLYLDRSEPTITLNGNATTTVQLADNGDNTWRIAGVTVTDGGSGWTQGAAITFNTDGADVTVFAATATARVVHNAPENAVLTIITTGGSGAVLEPVWELLPEVDWPAPGRKLYRLASVTVVNGGSGYADLDQIELSFASAADGTVVEYVYIDADYVGAGGEIEQVYVGDDGTGGGEIVGSRTDALHSVSITGFPSGGSYYRDDPGARRVTVTAGGSYYREDTSLPPYVATVTVGINQTTPSQGSNATIEATIDDDPTSETFGQVTGLVVTNGGDGYLAWKWTTNDCCGHYLNGKSVVLKRFKDSNAAACDAATLDFFGQYNILFSPEGGESYSVPSRCVYTTQFCGGWTSPFIAGPVWDKQPINDKLQLYVGFRGEGQRPVIKLGSFCHGGLSNNSSSLGVACLQDWIADEPIESCSQFSFSASPSGRPSVTVNSGGTYDPDWRFSGCGASGACPSCNVCCQGDEEPPEELEVLVADEWTTNRPAGLPNFSGTYVATSNDGHRWAFGANPPGFESFGGTFGVLPCHDGDWGFLFTPPRADCETCIKKCRAVFAYISGDYWHANFPFRVRIAPAAPASDCGECEDTPLCSMSGRSYALSFMTNSFSVTTGYGDGVTHAATVTIQ